MIKHKRCLLHLLAELCLNISLIVLCEYMYVCMSALCQVVCGQLLSIFTVKEMFCVCLALG